MDLNFQGQALASKRLSELFAGTIVIFGQNQRSIKALFFISPSEEILLRKTLLDKTSKDRPKT